MTALATTLCLWPVAVLAVALRGEPTRAATPELDDQGVVLLQRSSRALKGHVGVSQAPESPTLGGLLKKSAAPSAHANHTVFQPNREVVVVHHVREVAATTTTAPKASSDASRPDDCLVVDPSPQTESVLTGGNAADGSPCVFGVDERDEGKHCIDIGGEEYGSHGWCYTDREKSEWGSCSEKCPLAGPLTKLGSGIDAINDANDDLRRRMDLVIKNLGEKPPAAPTAPPEEIPLRGGTKDVPEATGTKTSTKVSPETRVVAAVIELVIWLTCTYLVVKWHRAMTAEGREPGYGIKTVLCCFCCTWVALCFPFDEKSKSSK